MHLNDYAQKCVCKFICTVYFELHNYASVSRRLNVKRTNRDKKLVANDTKMAEQNGPSGDACQSARGAD